MKCCATTSFTYCTVHTITEKLKNSSDQEKFIIRISILYEERFIYNFKKSLKTIKKKGSHISFIYLSTSTVNQITFPVYFVTFRYLSISA